MSTTGTEGQLQDFSVDQAAGAVVLVLGAIAGLLQVIWMSKCHWYWEQLLHYSW